jgi:hypothetical protein
MFDTIYRWSLYIASVHNCMLHGTIFNDFNAFVFECCRVEKYRPRELKNLISHEDIINTSKFYFNSLMCHRIIIHNTDF